MQALFAQVTVTGVALALQGSASGADIRVAPSRGNALTAISLTGEIRPDDDVALLGW